MQVVPGNAFQNTVSGSAAAQPGPSQPPAGQQTRVPTHAVKGAGRSHAALNAAQHRPQNTAPPAPQQQAGAVQTQIQPNAPRGSVLDILV